MKPTMLNLVHVLRTSLVGTSSAGGASSPQSPDVGDQRHLGVDGCGRHLDDGWRRATGPRMAQGLFGEALGV